jgi:serine/threonine protein kinase
MLLQILEDVLALDHRDLKADNLLITDKPSSLTFYMISKKRHYTVVSPFTVCIVDFGFACLGSEEGITLVDAGEGTLPPLDPCPKDGRDLYHLIVSFYALDIIHKQLSPELDSIFKFWMEVHGKPTDSMARRWSHSEWIYLLTSRKEFKQPACTPKAVIEKIMSFEPSLFLSS